MKNGAYSIKQTYLNFYLCSRRVNLIFPGIIVVCETVQKKRESHVQEQKVHFRKIDFGIN